MVRSTRSLAVLNGDVRTMDAANSRFEAVYTVDGRIRQLGTNEEIRELIGPDTVVIDAGGKTVLPAFADAHTHWSLLAKNNAQYVDARTPPVESVADIVERGRSAAAGKPAGEWVQLQGNTFQAEQLKEQRLPRIEELDAISRDHPVLYRASLHTIAVNSAALALAGIDENTVPPAGGHIGKDPDTGRLNGYLAEMYGALPLPEPTLDQLEASVVETGKKLFLGNGIASIQEFWETPDIVRAQSRSVLSREVPLRVQVYGWVPLAGDMDHVLKQAIDGVEEEADWFEFSGIKFFADGGTSARTAAVHEDYEGYPSQRGELLYSSDALYEAILRSHDAGAQILIHAAGDRAQDECLDAFERLVAKRGPIGDRQYRLEHCGNVLWTQERAARCLKLGVQPVPNIGFLHVYAEFWTKAFGETRSRPSVPLHTMLGQGFEIPGTSDTTGGDLTLINPFHNIWQAITRKTYKGRVLDAEEAITLDQGLRMYTRYSAIAARKLDRRGSLEVGKFADIVIASINMHDAPVDAIRDARALYTIVDGLIAHDGNC